MKHESLLLFAADHPAFCGHFPGVPIVPGVLLLDAALYAAEAAGHTGVTGIASAKFLQPVSPDQSLVLTCSGLQGARADFSIAHASQRVASGQLIATARPSAETAGSAPKDAGDAPNR